MLPGRARVASARIQPGSGEGDDSSARSRDSLPGSSRLPAARERELLIVLRQSADDVTRNQAQSALWQAHYGLVAAVASRFRRCGLEMADLIGAGQLGLHAAIVRFDPDRFPGRLSTYAVPWIRWYIQDHVNRNKGPVRLPSTTPHRQLARWGARLFEEALRDCHRERIPATELELCMRVGRRIGLPPEEVARTRHTIAGAAVPVDALDTVAIEDDDLIVEDSVIRRLDQEKLRRRVLDLADKVLGERERAVFIARCMTGSRPVVQLDALAARFGVSRERIYQLESSARRKIMTALSDTTPATPKSVSSAAPRPELRRTAS